MNKEAISKCLTVIAYEHQLKKDGDVWVAPNGVKYVMTMLGFIPAVVEEARKYKSELEDLKLQNKHLQSVISNHLRYERVLDEKAYIKIVRILKSRVGDTEKITQIKKYLNV